MTLYLFRHGEAEAASLQGDVGRRLTDEGKKKSRALFKRIAQFESFDALLTSPYTRAKETALIAAKAFGAKDDDILLSRALTPESDVEETLIEITALKKNGRVALFGHNPHLSELAAFLLSPTGICGVDLKKSSCMAIDCGSVAAAGQGTLLWYLTPKTLLSGNR